MLSNENNMLNTLYRWYGKRVVWSVAAIIAALFFIGLVVAFSGSEVTETEAILPQVSTASVASLSAKHSVELIGTVRAVSEAEIQSESGGRLTSVPVVIGQTVQAGQVIATIENASQQAAVLQAQGVYEAALANASVGDVSVEQAQSALYTAQNSTISTIRSAYTTVANGFSLTIDDLIRNPHTTIPTLYVTSPQSSFVVSERVAFESLLPDWQSAINNLTPDSDLKSALAESRENVRRTTAVVDVLIEALDNKDTETLNGVSVSTIKTEFYTLKSSLNSTLSSLDASESTLNAAEEALSKANIGGTSAEVSVANAQVKQALGSLRSAQAALAKTIMRSPISGTVNELSVHVGDFVGAFTKVAKVANNNALEVSAFVGENDLSLLSVGDSVLIDGTYPGTVTAIAAGLDSQTQKTEIKIATEAQELTNGDTVRIEVSTNDAADQLTNLFVPITAVKFTATNGVVFTVENNTLVAHEVTIGSIQADRVEILEGIEATTAIVVDARGLTAGATVTAN